MGFSSCWSALPRWGALTTGAVILVAACSPSGPGPSTVLRSSHGADGVVSASPSASPSRSLSREDEVVDVVRRFFAALDRAVSTGDTAAAAALMHPSCSCREVLASVHKEFANGGRTVGAHWTVSELKFFAFDGARALVHARHGVTAYRAVAANGSVVHSYGAHLDLVDVSLLRLDGEWKVAELLRIVKH